ncbi:MAG: OmpA family protein [Verrucomicrobiae bacterium]|nr:OmpA family protein [Verrucomicrobiae bacterium]NNJ85728.1 OmpA family protein [Akkermansiaceae bacterium]
METTDKEAPEETPQTTPSEPTSVSETAVANKPVNTQLTTALIVIIVVLLFVMLMLSMNGQLFQSGSDKKSDISELEARNIQLRADANAERARQGLPPLPESASSARMAADRLQRDATTLASLASQWQATLEEKDKQLRALESEATAQRNQMASLYKRINDLENRLASATNSADQVLRLTNDLKMAQNQIENFRKQLAELQGRPTNEAMAMLRKQLNESQDSVSKLQMQVDELQQAARNKIDRSEYDQAMAELAKLRPQLNDQRYEIQRLRSLLDRARLFIESEKDLPADAARLFARLKTLDKVHGPALTAAYKDIETTLGARVIHRQAFATGSSQITFDRETMIKHAMGKGAGSKSFFLVVGYASNTGDANSNRKLSAARATTTASVVNLLKTPQQDVRAVYLGKTDRFDKTNLTKNQICEVWEIKR